MGLQPRSAATRYGVALLVIAVATLIRYGLDSLLLGAGFGVFFVAVVIAAWFGGVGPSLLAITLSLLMSSWFFHTTPDDTPEPAARILFGLSAFFFVGLTTALLSESMRAAQRRSVAQAEEAVRQHEQLRITLSCIGDAVIVTDRQGQVTMMNPTAELLTGWSAMQAKGRALEAVFRITHEQTRQPVESPVGRVLQEGVTVGPADLAILTAADGTERPIDDNAAPIRDQSGNVTGVVLTFRDVTERRRTEQALRDADRRKDEFLATLAHELRNPLAPIRNGLELMKRGDSTIIEQSRRMMERQLAQLVRLIDDLMDISRITMGKLQLRKEQVKLSTVVQSAVEASRPLLEAQAHELVLALPPEPIYLEADPTRLAQILVNLLSNAAKYTEKGGRISISGQQHGSDIVLSVKDTGIGIAAEHLPHVFGMFSQVAPALERSQGGLGIGLSLVRGLVALHGGSVEARSDGPGTGSEFVVRLPLAVATPAAESAGAGDEAAEELAAKYRLLIVDDLSDGADSMAMLFRALGHEVQTAYDGEQAIAAAESFRPDVVLLDIGMPKLNGYEACRRIREQPWGKEMSLIAVTGWGQEEDRRRSEQAGFNRHLVKPVTAAAMLKLLGELQTADGR